MILELVSAENINGFLLKTSAKPCSPNYYCKSKSCPINIWENFWTSNFKCNR